MVTIKENIITVPFKSLKVGDTFITTKSTLDNRYQSVKIKLNRKYAFHLSDSGIMECYYNPNFPCIKVNVKKFSDIEVEIV